MRGRELRESTERVVLHPTPWIDRSPDAIEDGRSRRDVPRRPLLRDGPTTALQPDVVGTSTGDEEKWRGVSEGQDLIIVLQEHERLLHRFSSEVAMGR